MRKMCVRISTERVYVHVEFNNGIIGDYPYVGTNITVYYVKHSDRINKLYTSEVRFKFLIVKWNSLKPSIHHLANKLIPSNCLSLI